MMAVGKTIANTPASPSGSMVGSVSPAALAAAVALCIAACARPDEPKYATPAAMLTPIESSESSIVVSEAVGAASISTDIAARVTEHCFYSLQSPPLRVTSFHTPYPPSRIEEAYVPNLDRVMDAVDRVMAY